MQVVEHGARLIPSPFSMSATARWSPETRSWPTPGWLSPKLFAGVSPSAPWRPGDLAQTYRPGQRSRAPGSPAKPPGGRTRAGLRQPGRDDDPGNRRGRAIARQGHDRSL